MWEVTVGSNVITIRFLPIPFWLASKILYGSFRGRKSSLTYIQPSDTIQEVIKHCLVKVEVNYEEMDKFSLPVGLLYFLATTIMTLNGLTTVGGEKMKKSLNFLKEYTLSIFQEKEWTGRPPPPYFNILILSYISFTKGIPFSKSTFIEEPYVVVQAWTAISDAEQTYYKLLEDKTKSKIHTETTLPLSSQSQDLSTILHDKFSFPLPPLPSEK
ncbi:MAG: hypothetical protein QW815_00455 [Nitrososphaerota archaeon]